jgi:hypothetical protein
MHFCHAECSAPSSPLLSQIRPPSPYARSHAPCDPAGKIQCCQDLLRCPFPAQSPRSRPCSPRTTCATGAHLVPPIPQTSPRKNDGRAHLHSASLAQFLTTPQRQPKWHVRDVHAAPKPPQSRPLPKSSAMLHATHTDDVSAECRQNTDTTNPAHGAVPNPSNSKHAALHDAPPPPGR